MRNLNPGSHNCRRNGVIGLGLLPSQHRSNSSATINVNVTIAHNCYQVVVPSNSTFGYLKTAIAQTLGLNPEMHKLFFGDIEKEDDEDLQTSGVVDNSIVLLTEDTTCEPKIPGEVQQTCVASKGEEAVAEVRKEVDKLERQVSALKAVVDCGKKVDDKEIIYLTEMLMRQLLKLDGVEAEGEGKVQRKIEVRQVQSIVETLDALKSRNSNTMSNAHKSAAGATFDPAGCGSVRSVVTTFDPGCQSDYAYYLMPSSRPSTLPHHIHAPYPSPGPMPSYHIPTSISMPSSAPFLTPTYSQVSQNGTHYG